MGIVQDTLYRIRKFTLRDCFTDWNAVQNILLLGLRPGWHRPYTCDSQNEASVDRQADYQHGDSQGCNIHWSPDPRSSNPVFGDGVLIENAEPIFGIVEKKTVGASQGGLIHVCFREKVGKRCRRSPLG